MKRPKSAVKKKRIMKILNIISKKGKADEFYDKLDKIKIRGDKYLDIMYDFFEPIKDEDLLIPTHFGFFSGYIDFLLMNDKKTETDEFHERLFKSLK